MRELSSEDLVPQCNTDDYLSHLSGRLQRRPEFGRVERVNPVPHNHLRPTVVAPEQGASTLQLVPCFQLLKTVKPAAIKWHAGRVAHCKARSRHGHTGGDNLEWVEK